MPPCRAFQNRRARNPALAAGRPRCEGPDALRPRTPNPGKREANINLSCFRTRHPLPLNPKINHLIPPAGPRRVSERCTAVPLNCRRDTNGFSLGVTWETFGSYFTSGFSTARKVAPGNPSEPAGACAGAGRGLGARMPITPRRPGRRHATWVGGTRCASKWWARGAIRPL